MGIFKNRRYYIDKVLSVPVYIKIVGILFLAVVIIEFATVISIYLIFYKQEYLRLKKSGEAAGKIISYKIEDYIEAGNIAGLKKLLYYTVSKSTLLNYVIVRNEKGKVIVFVSKKGLKSLGKKHRRAGYVLNYINKNVIDLKFNILNDDESGKNGPVGANIGTLQLGVSSDTFHYFLKITVTLVIFILIPLVALIIIFLWWMSKTVLRPLSDLQEASESAKHGNYDITVKIPKFSDEKLAGLINGFNNMILAFRKTENKWQTKDLRRKEFIEEIIKAQELERKKLSRELHDEMEQFLVYINMKFKVLEKLYGMGRGNQDIEEMRSYIAKEFDNIKNITKELRPGVLYELGLYKAIMQYAEEIKFNHGIGVEIFTAGMQEFKADEYTEINIYRIFQETFSNIIRHSDATAVKIAINFENCIFSSIIEDNGKGFKPDKADKNKNENFGIIGMKERAEILGGSLHIKTKAGHGTTVSFNIPLDKPDENTGKT